MAPRSGLLGKYIKRLYLVKVDETKLEPFWNQLVSEYHYIGYEEQVGCRIKYLIVLGKQPIGAIGFSSAMCRLGPKDRYIGWDEATRLSMLPHIINNNRFLILPWINIKYLASHVLSESLK